jgi:hypothetical protein
MPGQLLAAPRPRKSGLQEGSAESSTGARQAGLLLICAKVERSECIRKKLGNGPLTRIL